MNTVIQELEAATGIAPIVLQLKPVLNLSDDQFFEFCQINRELNIELTSNGEVIVMSPSGSESSRQNSEINRQLGNWAKSNNTGVVYDSSAGFIFPNGAMRSPDASWISHARLTTFSKAQRNKFLRLCPDFVIELRSPTDRLSDLQAKLQEYIENGALLGLLIDPETKRVFRYQPNEPLQELTDCEKVSCEPVLPGFELITKEIGKRSWTLSARTTNRQ